MAEYLLTKIDIAALRQADRLVVAFNGGNASMRTTGVTAIKEKRPNEADPFAVDVDHRIDAPVSVLHRSDDSLAGAACFAFVGFYHSQHTHASSVIRTLRAGDEVQFIFAPDYHSTENLRNAGLHADVLLLVVRRDGRTVAEWELDHVTCPGNTARMCRGVASREYSLA